MDNLTSYLRDDLPGLLDVLRGTDVVDLELEAGSARVRVHRAGTDNPGAQVETMVEIEDILPAGPSTGVITATLVGTFYRAGKPGMPPLVAEGSRVEDETVVGIIEALHVLTEIEAGCRGTVTTVLATDGEPVEYGHALFEVELDD
jgi:acetyl-CoA carboxylase biotin carboxyl carrier protein